MANSDCRLCGKPNGFDDGGWLNINPGLILRSILEENGSEPVTTGWICQPCATLATAAWARECRRKDQEKKPPPKPTDSPAGAGTGTVEVLENVA